MCRMAEIYTLMVVWEILEDARYVANSRSDFSEAGIGAALMAWQKFANLC